MELEKRRDRKSRLRIIELLVWIIIVVFVSTIGYFIHIQHEVTFETHSIYMPDVDGLIVGSPVHIMGIPIGYVTKTKIIHDNEIKVKFKVTNKDVHIPEGTIATVEFSGLGGSKSLELYPPGTGKTPNELVGKNDFILVDRPKRLRDSMALLYEMYNKLMDMIYTTANFGHEMRKIDAPKINNKNGTSDINKFLNVSDEYINYYDKNMKMIRKTLDKVQKK